MNKKSLIITLAIIVAIGGGVAYLLGSSADNSAKQDMMAQGADAPPEQATDLPAATTNATPEGAYIDYTDTAITATKGTKLLFFHAPWCPQCQDLDADIKKNSVPDGVTIIKVDYDSNQALRKKYGVTIQTTLVRVDDQGNLVEKFVAYDDPSLQAVVRELL